MHAARLIDRLATMLQFMLAGRTMHLSSISFDFFSATVSTTVVVFECVVHVGGLAAGIVLPVVDVFS